MTNDEKTKTKEAEVGGVQLRTEKPVFDETGGVVVKAEKAEVKPVVKKEAGHSTVATITNPIDRMKKGVSKHMPAVKKTVLDKLKDFLLINTAKNKKTVEKVDKADKSEGTVKITAEDRKKYIEAEKIYQDGLASIKDLIAPSSMEIKYDSITLDGMYARSFYVYSYPRYLNTNWLAPLINFDVTMDISQFIYPINSGSIMKTLKKKVAQMQSSMSIMAEKGQVRDPALQTALQDAESLRTSIQRGQEKFFQFALYFTIYADSEKKLEKVSKQLESLLAGKLVMTKRCQVQAEHGFNSTIPQALDELDTVRNMNTSPLSTTFPFTSSDLTSDEGILYGINRHNDSLVIFDRFNLENANSVVFAKSGAGKSYAVKLEILRMMMLGTDVIVIDPENEYEALCQTVGGNYLKLSLNSDRRINPFELPKPIEGEEVLPGDLVRSAVINLHGLMKLMLGEMSPEEASLLDKALLDVYGLKGITMEVTDPSEFEPPTMEDLHNILSSMEGADSLAKRLEKFTTGSFSGVFNKPTNLDLTGGLQVFCIRDLEDELRPIAMYIILNYIWAKVRSEMKKRILVIDEAWSMMQHEDSAKFLYGLVKRARKYYLGVTTITQDVEDFVKSPHGKPIITNSSMQLLLKQAPAAIDVLAKMFNLTDGERYVLLNSGVGQGLFFAGNKHVAMQVIASYIEDKIVTTDPEQILAARQKDADFDAEKGEGEKESE
jgi:conjugal transfer ATP-binding protein TraC